MPSHPLLIEVPHRLRDLIAPRDCAACHGRVVPGVPLCPGCRAGLATVRPVAADPAIDTVTTAAAGRYSGVLRQCLLAYKEHRRRDLAAFLATALADTLAMLDDAARPVLLVPVPATRRALRHRGFDHVGLLGRRLSLLLPDAATVRALRCKSRPDSAGLGQSARIRAAAASLRTRPGGPGAVRRAVVRRPSTRVLLLDDIVTTGATLATAATLLRHHGVEVCGAVTVAATSRHFPRKTGSPVGDIPGLKR